MATTASSVGIGLARSMSVGNDIPGIAQRYYLQHGPKSGFTHFMDFVNARGMSTNEARELQRHLMDRFGLYGAAGQIPDKLVEEKVEERTVVSGVAPGGQAMDPNKVAGIAAVPQRRRRKKRYRKPRGITSDKRRRRVSEGLGLSPDADGRGAGVSGGSAGSEYGDVHRGNLMPGDEQRSFTCPRCGAMRANGATECTVCHAQISPTRVPANVSNTAGAMGVHGGQVGSVRVPGGPISSNENAVMRVKVLSHSLVEVTVGGVPTVHNWMVVSEALVHRLSPYGRSSNRNWLAKVHDWLWNRSKVGDEYVVTLDGRAPFVNDSQGYKYADSR